MKFTADEGVDAPIVKILRENGHDVFYIAEEEPSIPDTIKDLRVLCVLRVKPPPYTNW